MAGFGRGETLGKLEVKVRPGGVASAHGGQQPVVRPGASGEDTQQ
jgi:hypothetical protein